MNNIDFKSIAKAILNQKAIVFIGQELSLAYGKKNRLNEIYREIIAQSSQLYFRWVLKISFFVLFDKSMCD